MLSEIKKSISNILYERMTSPLYGTFIISWLIWNWKIPYVTFFENTDKLNSTKIDYIVNLGFSWKNFFFFPLLSTVLLILIIPFVSNGAYWVSEIFNTWKRNKKNEIENKQLLSLEQSIEIRAELSKQDENFIKILDDKNKEIETFKATITQLQSSKPEPILRNITQSQTEDAKYVNEYNKISSNHLFRNNVEAIAECINNGWSFVNHVPNNAVTFSIVNDIIKKDISGNYEITDRGKYYLRQFMNSEEIPEITI